MKTPPGYILELEERLKKQGVKIDEVLSEAVVDRSTWTRWKQGKHGPRMDSWMRVAAAAEKRLEAAA